MKTNQYEAMYLLENGAASADFDGTSGQINAVLEKHGAKVVKQEKWDERKLAYEIKGHRRATFCLTYYEADPSKQEAINEDLALTEVLLRHLTLRLEEPIEAHIEKRAKEREAMAEDSRRNSLTGWGDGRKKRDSGGRKPREGGEAKAASGRSGEGKPAEAKAEAKPDAEKGGDADKSADSPKQDNTES